MAWQKIPGDGLSIPGFDRLLMNMVSWALRTTDLVIDATGEKVAWVGRVQTFGGAKNLTRVQFPFASVTKTGGSGLLVSLQDVDAANGPLLRPDGTADQYRAIANGDAGFASSSWYRTGIMSNNGTDGGSVRSVSPGSLIAVVLEYDGSGRQGSDTVSIAGQRNVTTTINSAQAGVILYTAAWAITSSLASILLEFSDGSFGRLEDVFPTANVATTAFNLNTGTADEYGMRFTLPSAVKVDALWAALAVPSGADFELCLYQGTTLLEAIAVDANQIEAVAGNVYRLPLSQEYELAADTEYVVSVRPTTANSVTVYQWDVADNAHFGVWPLGIQAYQATRLNQTGAWTTTTTRRPAMGFRISSIHDGVGSGGGARSFIIGG